MTKHINEKIKQKAGFLSETSLNEDSIKYEPHMKKAIKATTENKTEMGVLDSVDDIYLYLVPCIVNEAVYNSEGESIQKLRLETERPIMIRKFNCDITPLRNDFLEEYINSVNNVFLDKY
ncbi:MAG: hypothetical protein ACOC3Z_01265 [Nanoarchaeota archaeon]